MKLTFILADDIQLLQNEKLLAVGLYSDRVVNVFHPSGANVSDETPFVLPRLGFLAVLTDLPVTAKQVRVEVINPNGSPTPYAFDSTLQPGTVHGTTNVLLQSAPFVATQLGTYKLRVTCEDQIEESEFSLRLDTTRHGVSAKAEM